VPNRSPLVAGRADTVTAISRALEHPGVHLVVGPPGIGKTTVAEAAARSAGRELLVGGGLPALADRPGAALARAIRVPIPPVVEDAVTVTAALAREAVVLLDDVHWADPHSLRVTTAAAGQVRALLCASEGGAGRERPGHGAAVLDGLRSAARTVVVLGPLPDEAVARIVRAADPAAGDVEVAQVVRAAGGNPAAALALATGDTVTARRSLAVAARDMTVAGRTALVVLGLRGRPTRARGLGPGAAELVEHGVAVRAGPPGDPVLAFPSAATYALAGSLASPSALADLHRRLAALSRDPSDRFHYLAAAGDRDDAVAEALRSAASLDVAGRARLLARAAELARTDRRPEVWRAAAEAAEAAGDVEAAAHARRRAATTTLTGRETEVMALVAAGMSTAAIARRLRISAETVETHVQSAVAKLGGRNRTEAAVLFATADAG
jgi:DNA-binding CsgD family transcriptional regulator